MPHKEVGGIVSRDVELGALHGSAPLSAILTLRTMFQHRDDRTPVEKRLLIQRVLSRPEASSANVPGSQPELFLPGNL